MSNLLSQASLVMIPSGYAEDKVYSAVPTDGSGDLSFTRASNGTRVNSAGLVEVVPWNLVQQSETFNTTWSAINTVVTANQTTAPNGTTTADLIVDNTNNTSHRLTQSVTNLSTGLDYYYSIYVKNNNHTWVLLRHDNGGTPNYFNIATGVKGTNTQANSTIESVGNGWYKLTVPFNVSSSSSGPEFYLASADGTFTYAGTGTGVYIWGASYTLSAKPYFPTTDRLNVPRLTYQNGGGGCPSLLLEKQSTNLTLYSQDISNTTGTYWGDGSSGGTATATANYATSPDGTQNATRLQLNQGSLYAVWQQVIGTTSGTIYTYSIWLKAVSGTPTILFLYDGTANQNVTLTNEWVRYTFTFTGGTIAIARFGLWSSVWGTSTSADILAYGAQLEASSYPTSYIPTTSASATRVADACFKDSITSLIGQTEGTIFADIIRTTSTSNDTFWVNISDGTTNDWIFMGTEGTAGRFYVRVGNSVKVDEYPAFSVGRHKIALAYKSGQIAGYMDGVQLFTSTATFTLTSLTRMSLGPSSASGNTINTPAQINQSVIFPTRLTNAELASITSL